MPLKSAQEWKAYLARHPEAHILQTPEWAALKEEYGWQVEWIQVGELGAQILFQSLPLGLSIGYLPRGPVSPSPDFWARDEWESFLEQVDDVCRQHRAIFLKVEADLWEEQYPEESGPPHGFQPSAHAIQPPRTLVISLREEEDEILMRMKSKTRYNIRLAGRKEVNVRMIDDVGLFYGMLENTADRADFGIHSRDYYRRVYQLLYPEGSCQLFLAEYDGQPLASIMVFQRGKRAWYFYGASAAAHRDRMPTYLIQWEAMRWAKDQGCVSYDLWGVPDHDFESLEDQFLDRSDGLWGVYRFKRGFGGELKRAVGPWDRVYAPVLYQLYRLWV